MWQLKGYWAPDLRSKVVGSIPSHASNFSTPDCKKINKSPSGRLIVVFSDYRLLWGDSDKDVDCGLTLPESVLHQIIIMVYIFFMKEK